ncbi:MAG: endolytic transglycosylase MltG, partial [Blastococcus sp.]
ARAADAGRHADPDDDSLVHDDAFGEDIPVKPYDKRTGRGRRKRSPLAVLLSLLVLAGLVFGIVVGGQKLLTLINPASRDYTGQGTGEVQIRVQDGDTLSDIARTLVKADVVASTGPFVKAAEANENSVGIQPGVYGMRLQMSGQAALDLLLDPAARLLSRVTLPEGLTVRRTLAKLAEQTGRPIEELNAAAADTASLGLPAYANGSLEGFLFPATYDVEPDTAPADILRQMVARGVQAMNDLQIPEADRIRVLTEASIVQAEAGSVEDMGKVATVLNNRLTDGMPLQLDTTVNYANGKSGITTTPQDRKNPSPYNTYLHPGLTPGPISNPGEEALRAVLNPTPGDWRYFVVVDPDTGETRFAVTGEEHQQNVQLFQQWLREHPNG